MLDNDNLINQKIQDKIREILKTVPIISGSSYRFKDKMYHEPFDDNHINHKSNIKSTQKIDGIFKLETMLYRVYHCCRESINDNNFYMHIREDNRDFVNELSQNNFGGGMWEGGWKIVKIENNGQIAAIKNDLTLWCDRTYFRLNDGTGYKLKIGRYGSILMPKEFRNLLPGFYLVNSNEFQQDNDRDILVRLYWNIQKSHPEILVKLISTHLNKLKVPFKFKILNDRIGYPRADAAVLYIYKKYYKIAEKTISSIYSEIKNFLDYPTPLFAKTMAPGLSLAEDPKNGESFGQNRSRIFAEAIYLTKTNDIKSMDLMIEDIARYFRKSNVNLNNPYLNPNSIDDYKVIG